MEESVVEIKIDSGDIDRAIEKADKLKSLLTEVNELIRSIGRPTSTVA